LAVIKFVFATRFFGVVSMAKAGYILQLIGMLLVTICLVSGMIQGDYNKTNLVQFLAGAVFFYGGGLIRSKEA